MKILQDIHKYVVECIDESAIKTYSYEAKNFKVLRLHGGEFYKLNGEDFSDYWRQWKQETGHTVEDLTDICIIFREGFDIEKFFQTGKEATAQTVSPTNWTCVEVKKFFEFTGRQLKSEMKLPFDSTLLVKATDGKKFLITTLDKPSPSMNKSNAAKINRTSTHTTTSQQKKSVPPAEKKILATREEILAAFAKMSNKHLTGGND